MPAVMSPLSPSSAFVPEPDLYPIYPSPHDLAQLLSPHSGLAPDQRHTLVQHSLARACLFGDLSLLTFLLADRSTSAYVDLAALDDDGLGFLSNTILGFGAETDRDVEREECVRLLAAEGADVNAPDKAGWTALHHAAMVAPPTLVSFLLTHGCSPFTPTRRGLTPLDILTAYSLVPGRQDVALLLEEAMREHGWTGGRMEHRRRLEAERVQRVARRKETKLHVGRVLGLSDGWWGEERDHDEEDESDDDMNEDLDDAPPDMPHNPDLSYTSMLVFSPATLGKILDSVTYDVRPKLRCAEPARALYLLTRFSCLACNGEWLEELMGGAVERIESIVFTKADDVPVQVFWLFNIMALLHFLRCDARIADVCDILDLFSLLEGVARAIYVFIIRVTERKVDSLLDAAVLDHVPVASEFDSIEFESEWSFLRTFASTTKLTKKKHPPPSLPPSSSASSQALNSPAPPPTPRGVAPSTSRPTSPAPSAQGSTTPNASSLRFSWAQSFTRGRASSHPPLPASFAPPPNHAATQTPTPHDITALLEAVLTLLSMAGINPALTTQIYSQVLYWTACEMFNRILTRKKYLCRSRAIQMGMNLSVLEEWVVDSGLPQVVESHFAPVRELLHWLQCFSSIVEFTTLVETIQTMKHLNPSQMRRAVRNYRYEVSEGRMSEECAQYLAQLQKDWEHRRVKLGIEALRREVKEREHERESSVSLSVTNDSESVSYASSSGHSAEKSSSDIQQQGIDLIFSRARGGEWAVPQAPPSLGELCDSRYMLPFELPSDPRLLAAAPAAGRSGGGSLSSRSVSPHTPPPPGGRQRDSAILTPNGQGNGHGNGTFGEKQQRQHQHQERGERRSAGQRGTMAWCYRGRKLRMIGIETLEWVDGVRGLGRWYGGAAGAKARKAAADGDGGEDGAEVEEVEAVEDEDEETTYLNSSPEREEQLQNGSEYPQPLDNARTVLTQRPKRSTGTGRRENSYGGETAVPNEGDGDKRVDE